MGFCIFYHIAVMSGWKDSHDIIESYLIDSKIVESCDQIVYCINGNFQEVVNYAKIFSEKQLFVNMWNDFDRYEFPTINFLKQYLGQIEVKALYIHTKCASHYNILDGGCCAYWLDTMCYYNISNFAVNAALLDTYDAIGSGYCVEPWSHFSGNFWWSKSSHIRKLSPLIFGYENFPHDAKFGQRHDAERWVCSQPGLFYNLGVGHPSSRFRRMYDTWEFESTRNV